VKEILTLLDRSLLCKRDPFNRGCEIKGYRRTWISTSHYMKLIKEVLLPKKRVN